MPMKISVSGSFCVQCKRVETQLLGFSECLFLTNRLTLREFEFHVTPTFDLVRV